MCQDHSAVNHSGDTSTPDSLRVRTKRVKGIVRVKLGQQCAMIVAKHITGLRMELMAATGGELFVPSMYNQEGVEGLLPTIACTRAYKPSLLF